MKSKKLFIIFVSTLILLLSIFVITFIASKNIYEFVKEYKDKIDYAKDKINTLDFEIKKIQLTNNVVNYNNLKFEVNYLSLPNIKNELYKPIGYIDIFDDNLIFVSGNGEIRFFENKSFKNIRSNLNIYINNQIPSDYDEDSFWQNPIRDILYHKGYLYVVLLLKEFKDKELYQTAILKGKFENSFIEFDYFFKTDFYAYSDFIDTAHVGGRLVVDQNSNFYIAVPDYGSPYENKVDKFNGIYGKVIKINSINSYEIISTGHRNPQGLYYDVERKILIESEHGPSGGDEINIIKPNKNYGWPSTSYGEGGTVDYHDHLEQGFEAPAYTWMNNPGASQIIKVSKNSKFPFKNLYILSSLSGSIRGPEEYSGFHLYLFNINDNFQATIINRIFINDRVRDIVYDDQNDRIFLVLENQKSIGIINTTKKF